MAIFRFFKLAVAAILEFQNFKLLTVSRLKSVELRRRAKFGQNQSNHGGDMAIFEFSKMAAVRHLGFCYACFRTTHEEHLVSLSLCKIWLESIQLFRLYASFTISRLRLENAYSHPQNCFFLGFDPLNGDLPHRDPQKALSCA